MNSRDPTCSSPLQPPATDKSVWIIASTSRSGNHNFLVLKHQVIPVLLSPDALASFPFLVECPYSHQILCKPSDLFVDYCPTILTWLIPCVNWIQRVKYPPCP